MTCAGAATATSPTRAKASRRTATISHTLDRAVVVGHSLGAMIALTFAVKRHDRVSRLVLEMKSALRAFLASA
jgi:pimeloyl-ACP methyl ester carboxylesterase